MKITEIRVFPMNEDRLKAYATITFDDCFVVRDLKIISGSNGVFVAMPSKKRKDGTYRDLAHPLTNEFRLEIENQVLEAYQNELKQSGSEESQKQNAIPQEATSFVNPPPVEAKMPDQIKASDYTAPDD